MGYFKMAICQLFKVGWDNVKIETLISWQRMSVMNCDAYKPVGYLNPGLMMIFATICSTIKLHKSLN